MDQELISENTSGVSDNSKPNRHQFFVEITGKRIVIAKQIKKINKESSHIKLSGDP